MRCIALRAGVGRQRCRRVLAEREKTPIVFKSFFFIRFHYHLISGHKTSFGILPFRHKTVIISSGLVEMTISRLSEKVIV